MVKLWDGTVFHGYSEDSIFSEILGKHEYFEESVLQSWISILKKAECVIDIGANLGNHSVFWAKYTDAKRIWAIEPYEENYKLLEENISENELKQIKAVRCAIGDRNAKMYLKNEVGKTCLGNAAYSYENTTENEKNSESVPGFSLDMFLQKYAVDKIDFLKIDAEGMTLEILEGARNCLENFKPDIWLECEADNVLSILELLEKYDYKMVDIKGFNLLFSCFCKDDLLSKNVYDFRKLLPKYLDMREKMLKLEILYYTLKNNGKNYEDDIKPE